ncbi:MAG: DNA-processing protein DprA, partial [Chitinophagales bacterium]
MIHPNIHYLALSFVDGIGAVNAKLLISYCGSAEAIFKESKAALLKIPGIGAKTVSKIQSSAVQEKIDEELAFIEKYKIKMLAYTDADFPQRLNHCPDAPLLLYQKGTTNLNATKVISIVGTRKATHYGKGFVQSLLGELQGTNIQVVSGMALGIDGQAHKSSIENGLETIGVLGHGLNTIYPAKHKSLAKEMLEKRGSLLTERNSQEKMVPGNFPSRNRIIAGMSDAVLVLESA